MNSLGGAEARAPVPGRARRATSRRARRRSAQTRSAASRRTRSASSTRRTRATSRPSPTRPPILDVLTADDAAHFAALRGHLDALGAPYEVAPRLVRGLDYYTRTLFEIKGATAKLGAGDTLVGGGRYDDMVERARRPDRCRRSASRPASSASSSRATRRRPRLGVDAFVAPLGEAGVGLGLVLARDLRAAGVDDRARRSKELAQGAAPPGERAGRALRLIAGDDEVAKGVVQLKDLARRRARRPSASRTWSRPCDGSSRRRLERLGPRRRHAPARPRRAAVLGPPLLAPGARADGRHGEVAPRRRSRRSPLRCTRTRSALAPAARRTTRRRSRAPSRSSGPSRSSLPRRTRSPSPPRCAGRSAPTTRAHPPSPVGELRHTSYFPYYEERRGDYRFRTLAIPPLWLEHTRGLHDPTAAAVPGEPTQEDRQSLFAALYYQRRSPKLDVDTLFPLIWRVRDEDSHLLVLGPFAHREAPFEHDNWLAPLYFEGTRKDGGYLALPPLLTARVVEREDSRSPTASSTSATARGRTSTGASRRSPSTATTGTSRGRARPTRSSRRFSTTTASGRSTRTRSAWWGRS